MADSLIIRFILLSAIKENHFFSQWEPGWIVPAIDVVTILGNVVVVQYVFRTLFSSSKLPINVMVSLHENTATTHKIS